MKINGFALSYIKQARSIFKEVDIHYSDKEWNLVVRRCQEIVELSLKAFIRSVGLEVPHRHDIGFVFIKNRDKLPNTIKPHTERIIQVWRDLSRDREISFYGDESTEISAQESYFQSDAEKSMRESKEIFDLVNNFFNNEVRH